LGELPAAAELNFATINVIQWVAYVPDEAEAEAFAQGLTRSWCKRLGDV